MKEKRREETREEEETGQKMKEETREEEETGQKMKEETREEEENREDKKREAARQEKRQDEEREMEERFFFQKNVSRPLNPPDELAQHVSKKNPFRTNYSSIFLRKFRIWPFFNYLHDSNSIFGAAGINSEGVFGRTVIFFQN